MDLQNLSIVRQTFANLVFTHKVQEIACEEQEKYAFYVKLSNIILVSVVLIMFALQLAYSDKIYSSIGSGLTIAEIIFLIIQLIFNFDQKAIAHKNSALKYMSLRDSYRLLIVDIMGTDTVDAPIIRRRDLLQQEYQIISDLSPQTNTSCYEQAQIKLNKKGVVKGEEFTWSDKEIDRFLPENLRLSKN